MGIVDQVTGFGFEHESPRDDLRSVHDNTGIFVKCQIDNDQSFLRQHPPLFQNAAAYIAHPFAIDHHPAGVDGVFHPGAVVIKFDHASVFSHQNRLPGDAHLLCQSGMQKQVPVFAVGRNKILGPCHADHQLQLFLKSMPGYMYFRYLLVDDVGAPFVELVDDVGDRFFIAWYEFG